MKDFDYVIDDSGVHLLYHHHCVFLDLVNANDFWMLVPLSMSFVPLLLLLPHLLWTHLSTCLLMLSMLFQLQKNESTMWKFEDLLVVWSRRSFGCCD